MERSPPLEANSQAFAQQNIFTFMKPDCSSPYLQQQATVAYSVPNKLITKTPTLFHKNTI
jgi:hypothetical protein